MQLEWHQLELRYEQLRRRNPARERALLASLAHHGQQIPVVVVGEAPSVLIDGYKRVRALRRLGNDTVEATRWPLHESDALIVERLMRPADGDDPLAQGWLLVELSERFGLKAEELSKRFDKSKSWITRRMGLVRMLSPAIQDKVRQGHIGAHAATKYLLPLARANAPVAEQLAETIAPLRLSNRQVHELYAGWTSGSDKTRELIAANPELYLRAQQQARDSKSKELTDARAICDDLEVIGSVARRTRRRLLKGAWQTLLATERHEVVRSLGRSRADVQALFDRFELEDCDARPRTTHCDS